MLQAVLFLHENGVKILCVKDESNKDDLISIFNKDKDFDGIIRQEICYVSQWNIEEEEKGKKKGKEEKDKLTILAEKLKIDIILMLKSNLGIELIKDSHIAKVSHFCLCYDISSNEINGFYNAMLVIEQFHSIKSRLNID